MSNIKKVKILSAPTMRNLEREINKWIDDNDVSNVKNVCFSFYTHEHYAMICYN